jgi:hypothetical protein
MTNDAQNASFGNVAAQHPLSVPLDPAAFYATGHPDHPIPATNNLEKRPRSASTVQVEPESTKKPKTKHGEKENKPPKAAKSKKEKQEQAAANEAAAAAAIERDEILGSTRWSITQRTKLFEWLLGADADERFNTHKKNPGRIYKKVTL